MTLTAILFDLDGTLLPLEFNEFIPGYLGLLNEKFRTAFPDGSLARTVMVCTDAMVNNDGSTSNADAFWTDFEARTGQNRIDLLPAFEKFYRDDFGSLGAGIGRWEKAASAVGAARQAGLKTVLATNPVFPRLAVEHRLEWAGVAPAQFDFITDYENMSFAKPNPLYYTQIATEIEVPAESCLMIGNDVRLDLAPAQSAGMKTFMVRSDYSAYGPDGFSADREGTLEELITFLTA